MAGSTVAERDPKAADVIEAAPFVRLLLDLSNRRPVAFPRFVAVGDYD